MMNDPAPIPPWPIATPLAAPITPVLAADDRFRLLANLVEDSFGEIDLSVLLVYLIDIVPARLLPHLADQFHVMGLAGWELAPTETQRRTLIKNAIELHRYKGTPWAIEQILATLGMRGTISEWFDYGGKPYRFKIDVDLSGRGLGMTELEQLTALILKYKNKRSRLQTLSISVTVRSPVPMIAAVLTAGEVIAVTPWIHTDIEQAGPLRVAAGCWVIETLTIYPRSP